MDETFVLFLQDIPAEYTGFVLTLDEYLTTRGSKRTVKAAKSGFVASYTSPKTGRALLNYVFRKTGVKVRVYAEHIGSHPEVMKAEIQKAGGCKRLSGQTCSPTCKTGYTFVMDGVEYRKCKNTAFFHSLTAENLEHILNLVKTEMEHDG